jgi:transcriptional regulator with XRE-family HTH domain
MDEVTNNNDGFVRGDSLGRRLRSLRESRGMSLRESARQIGISPSSLSELENDRGGVSLRRLQLVVEHLGVHITDVLPAGQQPERPAPGEREVIRAWTENSPGIERGRGVTYQLLGDGHGHAIQPYMISFAPGAGYAHDRIGHPGEEFAYVLLGSIEVVLADEIHALSQGDAIRFDTTTPHAFRNASRNGVAVVVGAATPPW